MTDGELVRRARSGEALALAELMNRWAPKALALSHVHAHRQVAADLAQESLLRAIRHLPQLKTPEHFGSWLRGIVRRVCCDWLDSKKRAMIPFSSLQSEVVDVKTVSEDGQSSREADKTDLEEACEALPLECREVLQLYYSGNMTYQELGDMLDVSAATINARLTRARSLLRERLLTQMETRS